MSLAEALIGESEKKKPRHVIGGVSLHQNSRDRNRARTLLDVDASARNQLLAFASIRSR